MTEKWFITGGCGFVGSNLAASLLESGHEVVALDDLSRVGSEANLAWLRERAATPGAAPTSTTPSGDMGRASPRSRTSQDKSR